MVKSVKIHGENPDAKIPHLKGLEHFVVHKEFSEQMSSWYHWKMGIDAGLGIDGEGSYCSRFESTFENFNYSLVRLSMKSNEPWSEWSLWHLKAL